MLKTGISQNGWLKIMENPIKIQNSMDLGVKTNVFGHTHMGS